MFYPQDYDDERISAFIDGQLTDDERKEFVAAMQSDSRLAQHVAALERLSHELRQLPSFQASDDFADRLLASPEFQQAWQEQMGRRGAMSAVAMGSGSPQIELSAHRTEWSMAMGAIAALACMLLVTLFWPAIFQSPVPVAVNRSDEAPTESASAEMEAGAFLTAESTHQSMDAPSLAAEAEAGFDALNSKISENSKMSGAELDASPQAMKVEGVGPVDAEGMAGRSDVAEEKMASGFGTSPNAIARNAKGARDFDSDASDANPPSASPAQMAMQFPRDDRDPVADAVVDDAVDGAFQQGLQQSVAPQVAMNDDRGEPTEPSFDERADHLEGQVVDGQVPRGFAAATNSLNIVQIDVPDDPESMEYVQRVFATNQLVAMPKPSNSLAGQRGEIDNDAARSASGMADQRGGIGGGGNVAGDASQPSAEVARPTNQAASLILNNAAGDDAEALYTITSPEQMQKVVLELSARARVSMFRLSEDELAQQVQAIAQMDRAEQRAEMAVTEDAAKPEPKPTLIQNFSQRMEIVPRAKSAEMRSRDKGQPGEALESQSAKPQVAGNEVSPGESAEPESIEAVPAAPKRARRPMELARRVQSDADQWRAGDAPGMRSLVAEGVDASQIDALNAYFHLAMPTGPGEPPGDRKRPRMEQFILLIRKSRPASGELDRRAIPGKATDVEDGARGDRERDQ